MDQTYLDINDDPFPVIDWKVFYSVVREPIPQYAPNPLDKPVDIGMFIDSNQARDKQIRLSPSSFLIYVSTAVIDWHQHVKLQLRKESLA